MYITINKGPYSHSRFISCGSDFFNGNIRCVNLHDKIMFSRPSLDYSGKQYKPTKGKYKYMFGVAFELPLGSFKIDEEESNEDCIVVYFKDKIL